MILLLDTETTGREPPEVIELAYAEWNLDTQRIQEKIDTFRFRSTLTSSFGALATHHILDAVLAGFPPSRTASLPPQTTHIIGHNVDYDWNALGNPEVKRICTLAIARKLYPECDSHSLGAMLYRLHPSQLVAKRMLVDAHSAAADVVVCSAILSFMLFEHHLRFSSIDELWSYSELARVPTIWSFGKFKGLRIEQADRGYLQWCLKQKDMDPYVLEAVRRAM